MQPPWNVRASVPGEATGNLRLPGAPAPSLHALGRWSTRHQEHLWIAGLLLVAALAHGINMFHFPYYETDEGTYMSQAWAVAEAGELAPYTYWYDHAPLGWIQIALWTTVTGFYTFGSAVDAGRVFMLVLQIASTLMVYRIARNLSGSAFAATLATLAFALSPYGIYYHRRVLLDNIATAWMLLSLLLLVGPQPSLTRVWGSAAALGISVLSKELTIILVPCLVYLVWVRSHVSQRWLAALGWVAIVLTIISTYVLMAALKSELFPSGTPLGGTSEHVSLLETLQFQASRERDAGLFELDSGFWENVRRWARQEPLLVLVGSLSAGASLLALGTRPGVGVLGAAALSLWAFLGRGGIVIGFYLVPLLPLLALNVGVLAGLASEHARSRLAGAGRLRRHLARAVKPLTLCLCLGATAVGYTDRHLGFASDPTALWNNQQANAQRQSIEWVKRNVPEESGIVIDNYMWTDLHDPSDRKQGYDVSHWHWKVDLDPEIRDEVFGNDWRNIEYIITTPQMLTDTYVGKLQLVREALEHSTPIAHFDTGGWPITVRRVHTFRQTPAPENPVLLRTWSGYKTRFLDNGRVVDPGQERVTTSEGQAYALLRAVYLDDRKTFDQVWRWTETHLQVRTDGLLAWRWGKRADGSQGVLDEGAATDADQDVALALLFAARRWSEPHYQEEALAILHGIWEQETTTIGGQRVLVAGPWARGGDDLSQPAVLNPSYFAPYAYRIFAEADSAHPWMELVDSSYAILAQLRASPTLGGDAGLVPNWVLLDTGTNTLRPADGLMGAYAQEFSYDASRLPWRLAVDWVWFRDERARQALEGLRGIPEALERAGRLVAAYHLDGTPAADYEALSLYAGSLPSLLVSGDPGLLHRTFAERVLGRYVEGADSAHWGEPDNYYDQNWAWFATALMDGALGNLWAGETVIDWERVLEADAGREEPRSG